MSASLANLLNGMVYLTIVHEHDGFEFILINSLGVALTGFTHQFDDGKTASNGLESVVSGANEQCCWHIHGESGGHAYGLLSIDGDPHRLVTIAKGVVVYVWWNTHLQVQPGTKVGALFDLVEKDEDAKSFLSKACWCDLGILHAAQLEADNIKYDIYEYDNEKLKRDGMGVEIKSVERKPAEFLRMSEEINYGVENSEGWLSRYLEVSLGRFDTDKRAVNYIKSIHDGIRDLELQLLGTAQINPSDENHMLYEHSLTLGEVLIAIYKIFGKSPDYNKTEISRIEFQEVIERATELFDPDPADWWKDQNTEEDG